MTIENLKFTKNMLKDDKRKSQIYQSYALQIKYDNRKLQKYQSYGQMKTPEYTKAMHERSIKI